MFILDKPASQAPTYVFIKKTINGQSLKYSLKRKIHPDNWDKDNERAHPSARDKALVRECFELNNTLDDIEKLVNSFTGSREDLIWELNELLGFPNVLNTKDDFFDVIEGIIADRREGRELFRGKIYSKETIRAYVLTKDNLLKFQREKGVKLTMTMGESEYEALLSYLNEIDHSLNTVGKTTTHLRTFLYAAQKRGYKVPILAKKIIKKVQEDAFDIYLTKEKIVKIYKTETGPGYPTLAREWFVIGCFTGLRVSDLTLLHKDRIIKDNITVANEKTDVRVVIPVHWTVREILNKYNGHFPPDLPDSRLNEYIKKVAKTAGFEDPVFYSMTKGGKRTDIVKLECDMISTHTGRRSFITNLLKDGFPANVVMKLAGIRDSRTLSKYDKISGEEVADIVSKHSAWLEKPGE